MSKQKTPKAEADTLPLAEAPATTTITQIEQDKAWLEFARTLTPYEALVLAISACRNVAASRINPHFKSRYYGLSDLLDEVKPTFGRYGLVIFQVPASNTDRVWISTSIIHISGWVKDCDSLGLPSGNLNPQNIGSAFTYLKRYAISTIVGVASELEDDDGNQASKPGTQTQTFPKPQVIQAKPQASGQWWTEMGLTNEEQIKVATDILVVKGWLPDGAPLSALPQAHITELATPKMRQAFLEAVKHKLS
jgi:hypothetical protein